MWSPVASSFSPPALPRPGDTVAMPRSSHDVMGWVYANGAFSSLDVLVAMDEGLFSAEGLDLQMASRESRDIRSTTEGTLSSPVTNQGRLHERGEATMFQG